MIAVIGSGPAALMAADVLSQAGLPVSIFEKRKSAGRKLLVAGSSGLNITNGWPLARFVSAYTGPPELWQRLITNFPPSRWLAFIEALGMKTFEGSSGRYFIEDMKASKFLQAWLARLAKQGVAFHFEREFVGFSTDTRHRCEVEFLPGQTQDFDAVCLALGGGSWEPNEVPLRWPGVFKSRGLKFDDFTAANVGYRVAWPEAFLKEAEGLPLKRIVMTTKKGSREGDAMITRYGIEGTPVYFTGEKGIAHLDLRPDLTPAQILAKLRSAKENLSPIRRVKKQLGLCPASFALLFHLTPPELLPTFRLVDRVKAFPLSLLGPQPLEEAISSAGGLSLSELDEHLMIQRFPGFFAAGEMLSWDVPTGGFLIQGCVAQGFAAAQGIIRYLKTRPAL